MDEDEVEKIKSELKDIWKRWELSLCDGYN